MGKGAPVFEFLSSPFGLVAVGLGVLAVAVLALCLWITTLDRRMRGMADGLETERRKVAELQMVIGRRANAARSYGNRGRAAAPAPAPAPAPASAVAAASAGAPMPPRGAAAPMPMGVPAGASVPPRNAVPASAAVPSGAAPRGRAPRPAPARPGRQRLDAQQHPDAGAVGGGCLGAGRPGRAATHCGARSQDVTQGSPRGGARLRGPRGCRTGGSPGPSRPGGRRGPALFRVDPGPRGSSFCAPRRSRPSCCGRSRPGPGLRAGAAGLRCAFRRSRPPRALAVFPLRHFPKLKRPAPRMLSALAFSWCN